MRGNVQVLVAGDGSLLGTLYEHLDHLKPHVRFLGRATAESMLGLIQATDVVFLPSVNEGISLTQFEAMAAGKVFVGANVGGQGEIITPSCDCGVLVPPNDNKEVEVESTYYM